MRCPKCGGIKGKFVAALGGCYCKESVKVEQVEEKSYKNWEIDVAWGKFEPYVDHRDEVSVFLGAIGLQNFELVVSRLSGKANWYHIVFRVQTAFTTMDKISANLFPDGGILICRGWGNQDDAYEICKEEWRKV